ncbi:MAG TPA: hypothetical protein VHF22_00625, partial [Planctomycetota bacterium]|nr:hypothetical protein [Planctomycetota bacterium]
MRKPIALAAALALVTAGLSACSSPAPVARPEPRPAEAALAVETAFAEAVTLAAQTRPGVDRAATNARINRFIVEVGIESRGARTTRDYAEGVGRVFFGHFNFMPDPDDP